MPKRITKAQALKSLPPPPKLHARLLPAYMVKVDEIGWLTWWGESPVEVSKKVKNRLKELYPQGFSLQFYEDTVEE